MLRSKLEYDKSDGGKRKRNITTDSSSEAPATLADYIPPWFDRYVEYKFNLLDRAGQSC